MKLTYTLKSKSRGIMETAFQRISLSISLESEK